MNLKGQSNRCCLSCIEVTQVDLRCCSYIRYADPFGRFAAHAFTSAGAAC